MVGEKSVHDTERDRIANDWCDMAPFTCAACRSERSFPESEDIRTGRRTTAATRLRARVLWRSSTATAVERSEVVRLFGDEHGRDPGARTGFRWESGISSVTAGGMLTFNSTVIYPLGEVTAWSSQNTYDQCGRKLG